MSITVAPATAKEYEATARMLFARLPAGEQMQRVERFVAMVSSGELDSSGLLLAKRDGVPVAAEVVQFLPGGSAVVMPPSGEDRPSPAPLPSQGREQKETPNSLPGKGPFHPFDALAEAVVACLRLRSAPLAYLFLDPNDEQQADPLVRHGFRFVTRVTHMLRTGADARLPPKPSSTVEFVPAFDDLTTFGETLLASYEGTLDVPEACAHRTAEDILAGYRTNQPDPPLWWLARSADGKPVGVVLLTVTDPAGGMDLGYLGVVATARGQGVGRALLRHAIWAASIAGFPDLNLSVDERNEPALRLYRAHSFRTYQWQQVFLWRPSW
jgi:GNAT superfamily N-acetyltransferase